jgi:RNA polymerase-associated protein CTR9
MALQQYESHYPKALERYQKAIELLQRKKQKVSYQYYTNCGVLCHETKKYEQSMEMYLQALTALDEDGSARLPKLKDTASATTDTSPQLKDDDNNMFFGFAATKCQVSPSVSGNKTYVTIANTSVTDVPMKVGDIVRLGPGFISNIVGIHEAGNNIELELADEYDPMDENVAPSAESSQTVFVEVQRENGLLELNDATTIAFNIARLHEATGRILAAIELHKAILRRNPAYVNSYLRLACIAVDCGALRESSEWLRIAAETAPGNPEVLTLVGNLHLSLADWQPAQKVFDSLLMK